jgi:hypothetical protein
MRFQPSLLWTWNRAIDRGPYVVIGATLFLVKFAIDWLIATQVFGRPWSLVHYLIWPNDLTVRGLNLADPDRTFYLTLL